MPTKYTIKQLKKLYKDNGIELSQTEYIMATKKLENFLSCIEIMKKERLKNGNPLPEIPEKLDFEPYEIV